jgi:hypothetical protein
MMPSRFGVSTKHPVKQLHPEGKTAQSAFCVNHISLTLAQSSFVPVNFHPGKFIAETFLPVFLLCQVADFSLKRKGVFGLWSLTSRLRILSEGAKKNVETDWTSFLDESENLSICCLVFCVGEVHLVLSLATDHPKLSKVG